MSEDVVDIGVSTTSATAPALALDLIDINIQNRTFTLMVDSILFNTFLKTYLLDL